MNELTKIAESGASYLVKCAEVAKLFADGKVTGQEADTAAVAMGLDIDDVADVYTSNYGGHTGSNIEKTASEQVEEGTYLQKTASVADLIASGTIATSGDITKVAMDHDLAVSDIESIYNLAYGPSELDKTAALNDANSILADVGATYLDKTAAIASMYSHGIVTSEDATAAAQANGINPEDVNAMLDKEADAKKTMFESAKEGMQKAKDSVVGASKSVGNTINDNKGKTAAGVGVAGTGVYAMGKKKESE